MPRVKVKENEGFEHAMRRFKRSVEKSGVVNEMRRRRFFERPCQMRKRKKMAAIKRQRKRILKESSVNQKRRLSVNCAPRGVLFGEQST